MTPAKHASYPPNLVDAVLVFWERWDEKQAPSHAAVALLNLTKAVTDLRHFASWHYRDMCEGCPASQQDSDKGGVQS